MNNTFAGQNIGCNYSCIIDFEFIIILNDKSRLTREKWYFDQEQQPKSMLNRT